MHTACDLGHAIGGESGGPGTDGVVVPIVETARVTGAGRAGWMLQAGLSVVHNRRLELWELGQCSRVRTHAGALMFAFGSDHSR